MNPLQPHYVCPNCKHSDFNIDRTKYACGVDMPDADCPVCGTKYKKLGYEIPFEVFLGFKGDKTPDIDLNFSGEYQPVAHKYVEEMFGEGHAFRAGTISGLQDKTIYGYIKGYCEQQGVSFNKGETERLVAGCVGVKRTTGQHPGGIVIVPQENDIIEFSPVPVSYTHLSRLTYDEVIERDLKATDLTAITLCREQHIPILVFAMKEKGNILKAVQGEDIGTLIH